MRTATTLLALLVLAVPATAAAEIKARFSINVTLDDAFFDSAQMPQVGPLMPGGFTIPAITGMLYMRGEELRMDMTLPQGVMTTLYDGATGEAIMLDHNQQTAWRTDLPADTADAPLFNLEQLAGRWPAWERELRSRDGLKFRELGKKKVNGQASRGVRMSGDLSHVVTADEIALLPGIPNLRDLRGPWEATAWVSESLGLPVKLTSRWRGMTMVWQIAGVESWQAPATFFDMPPGYRLRQSAGMANTSSAVPPRSTTQT